MTEQAVAKPNDQTESDAADTGEQDIEAILKEYEQNQKPKEPEKPKEEAQKDPELAEVLRFIKEQKEQKIKEDTDKSVEEAVKAVFGDAEVPDQLKRDLIYGRFSQNERYLNVWRDRFSNPEAYNKLLAAMNKEISSAFKFDAAATTDREQVRAAVRQSQPASKPDFDEQINKMSDSEFDDWWRKQTKKG